jgi:PTS system mannose-specific IIA component
VKEDPMLGLLVITHGRLAEELVRATQTIVGQTEALEAISIGWDDDVSDAQRRIEESVQRLGEGGGVLVLTDMFGGTPTNIALSLLEPGKVEVVTGVNLPMLIKFTNLRDEVEFQDVAHRIAEQGKRSIHVASALLQGRAGGGDGEPV